MTQVIDTLTPAERKAFDRVRDEHMARDRMQRRENLHHKGACWSGFSAGAYPMPTDDEMLREAKERVARSKAHDASARGKARAKLGELEKLTNRLMFLIHETKDPMSSGSDDVAAARIADILNLLDQARTTSNDMASEFMVARAGAGQ